MKNKGLQLSKNGSRDHLKLLDRPQAWKTDSDLKDYLDSYEKILSEQRRFKNDLDNILRQLEANSRDARNQKESVLALSEEDVKNSKKKGFIRLIHSRILRRHDNTSDLITKLEQVVEQPITIH